MNIESYERELEMALDAFTAPDIGVEKSVLTAFDVAMLDHAFRLVKSQTIKMAATHENLTILRALVVDSLRVLYAACRFAHDDEQESDIAARFKNYLEHMQQVSRDKNNDYSPFNILKCGNLGLFTRLGDKTSRIVNGLLADTTLKVKDESLIDTALDAVNYSVYQIMIALDEWVTVEERLEFQEYLNEHGGKHLRRFYAPGLGPVVVQ